MSTELMSDEQINDIWNALEKSGADMIGGIAALVRRRVEFARAIEAQALAANRSQHPEPVIDTCDHGHKFAKLSDHPLRDGKPRCLHCLAIGFDEARSQHPSPAPADERAAFEVWADNYGISRVVEARDAYFLPWQARASLASPRYGSIAERAEQGLQKGQWASPAAAPVPSALEAFRQAVIARGRPQYGAVGSRDVDVAAEIALYDTALATPIPVAAPAGCVSGSVALAAWEETFDKNESINDAWQRVADRVVAAIPSGEGQAPAGWAEWWAKNRRDEATGDTLEDLARAACEFGRAGEWQAVDALRELVETDDIRRGLRVDLTSKTYDVFQRRREAAWVRARAVAAALSPPQTAGRVKAPRKKSLVDEMIERAAARDATPPQTDTGEKTP